MASKLDAFRRLLSYGSQTAPRIADDIAESANPISRELVEETPEVLGKSSSRVSPVTGDIPEAAFEEITPNTGTPSSSWLDRMDPRLKAFVKGGALGGGAGYIASELYPPEEGEDSTHMVPQQPMKAVEPKQPEEIKAEAKKTVKTEAPKEDGLDFDALSKKFDEGMSKLPKEQEPDEFDLAKEQVNRNAMLALLGKAATQIGGGFASLGAGSQVKVNGSGFDDLLKLADRPLTQLQESQKYKKAKDELNDEAKMRDPNSEISKLVSGLAIKTGLIKPGQTVSANNLKNAGVNLGTLLSTIEAGKARKEAAALARETRVREREDKQAAKAEEKRIEREDKRKLITEEVEDRYQNLNDSVDELKSLVNKYGTFEVFGSQNEDMNRLLDTIATDMAKYTDPDSVARPSEVALWRKNLIKTGTSGLGMSNATAEDILDNFKSEIEKRRGHAYKVRGVVPEGKSRMDNNSKQVVKKQYSLSRNQTKLIFDDGSEEVVDGKQ